MIDFLIVPLLLMGIGAGMIGALYVVAWLWKSGSF